MVLSVKCTSIESPWFSGIFFRCWGTASRLKEIPRDKINQMIFLLIFMPSMLRHSLNCLLLWLLIQWLGFLLVRRTVSLPQIILRNERLKSNYMSHRFHCLWQFYCLHAFSVSSRHGSKIWQSGGFINKTYWCLSLLETVTLRSGYQHSSSLLILFQVPTDIHHIFL